MTDGRQELFFRTGPRQHLLVPPIELSDEALQQVGMLCTKVCLFVRVRCQIKQVLLFSVANIFPVTLTRRVLIGDTPEERALEGMFSFDYRQQIDSIERIAGGGGGVSCG